MIHNVYHWIDLLISFFNKFTWRYKYCTYFLQIESNLWHAHPKRQIIKDGGTRLDGCRGFVDFLFAGSTSVESDQKVEAKSAPERGDERVEKLRPGRTAADADACACGA